MKLGSLRRSQAGFSLIELSVVVAVLGAMTFVVTAGFENVQAYRQHRQATADAQAAYAAVRAFALRNRRLPCPDSSTDGRTMREAASPCARPSGWLPYESIGLTPPAENARMRYGVYIQGSTNLATPTASASDGLDLDGVGGLLTSLVAAATHPGSTLTPYYVQGTTADSSAQCSSGNPTNPAFVIVAPASDIERSGNNFESVNQAFGLTSHCTSAPSHRANAVLDDVVIAESPHALLGWLTASLR